MSPFTVLVLCIQACLIQSVLSDCGCGNNIRNVNTRIPAASCGTRLSPNLGRASSVGVSSGNYGGVGTGQVGASGEVRATGETAVRGSVPVLGEACFSGSLPASGSVSITGQCGCGCA